MHNNVLKASLLSAAISAVTLATPAFAADSGWYLGLGAGQSTTSDWVSKNDALDALDFTATEMGVTDFSGTTHAASDDSGTSVKVFGGYQYTPYFAVELGYTDLGENTAKASASGDFTIPPDVLTGTASIKATGETSVYTLDAIGRLNATTWLTLFARAGVYQADTELTVKATIADSTGSLSGSDSVDDSNSGFHFGAGIDLHITQNVAIRAEWERFDSVEFEGDEVDIDNMSVSAIYTF